MKLAKALAAVAALSGLAGAVHASPLSNESSTGNSNLVFFAYDSVAGKSYYSQLSTGERLDSISNGSFTMTGLSSLFSGSLTSNIWWGVVAGDSTPASASNTVFGTRALMTATNVVPGPNISSANGQFPGGASANMQAFNTTACGDVSAGNACTASTATDPHYAGGGNWGADWGSTGVPSGDFLSNNASMKLWTVTPDTSLDEFSAAFLGPLATATAFTASLDLAGNTVTISSGTAPVPLPAAIWLLGSALAGMGALGRRRQLAAA